MPDASKFKFTKVYHRDGAKGCPDLIISVHGMGDQFRNNMTHTVAALFAKSYVKDKERETGTSLNQALRLPQGLWEGEWPEQPQWDDVISFAPAESALSELSTLGFAELYWADMPRGAERDGHRLEDSPQWAGSVVDRLRQRNDLKPDLNGSDLTLGATLLEELAELLNILKNLFFLTDKAGIFTFDLGTILAQYLGDVQQVADFRYIRERLVGRFMARIAFLAARCPNARLHFVAHSEGTVIIFLTLLQAMYKKIAGSAPPPWLDRVVSMTTFGSPIDKHLILWPELWGYLSDSEEEVRAAKMAYDEAEVKCQPRPDCVICQENIADRDAAFTAYNALLATQRQKWHPMAQGKNHIRWRNYYDKADPVGFDLDTARAKLLLWGCEAFEFTEDDDFGFRRYVLAGQAHVDYFGDVELFGHIRESAIFGPSTKPAPQDTWKGKTSPVWPFVIVALLHLVAVFILHQSLAISPEMELPIKWPFHQTGLIAWAGSYNGVLGGAALMLAVTIFTRAARIAGFWRTLFGWPVIYTGLCLAVVYSSLNWPHSGSMEWTGFLLLLKAAGLASLVAFLVDFVFKRKGWSPVWGLRLMMIIGGGAITASVVWMFRNPKASMLTTLGGAAAFLYLWWLAVLLFDLSYVWKRYINTALDKTYVEGLRKMIKGRVRTCNATR